MEPLYHVPFETEFAGIFPSHGFAEAYEQYVRYNYLPGNILSDAVSF